MKIPFRHKATRSLLALLVVSTISWIIVFTGVFDYWTWILLRRATLSAGTIRKVKWEQLRGKRMAEYVNPSKHNLLLQPNITAEVQNPFAVIFIITSPEAKERRMWIRNTWYTWKNTHNVTIIFFTGKRKDLSFKNTNDILQAESNEYQDIVMDDFEERYYALPIKVLRVMKFYLKKYEESSNRLPFFVKVDDDVFVNVPNLLKKLESRSSRFSVNINNGFIAGHVHQFSKMNSNPRSKHYIPYDVWDGYWFPAYAAGPCYMISGNLIRRIFDRSMEMPFFPFEDVFITGIVANLGLGFSPVHIEGIPLFFSKELSDKELLNSVALAPNKITEEFMKKCFQRLITLSCEES